MRGTGEPDGPVVVARVQGRLGELVLRRDGAEFEVVSNGVFLMDTRGGRSERLLVRAALAGRPGPAAVLLGGLGVGCSLREALRRRQVARVTVVEVEPAVIEWNRGQLGPAAAAALADPRVELVCDDLVGWIARTERHFDAICLDIDNGPGWTVAPANDRLYTPHGLALLRDRLLPGGRLAVWSAAPADRFEADLRRVLARVEVRSVPARAGGPDVVYLACAP